MRASPLHSLLELMLPLRFAWRAGWAVLLRLLVAILLTSTLSAPIALAESNEVTSARIDLTEEGFVLNADLKLQLSQRVAQSVENVVDIYFVSEIVAVRPRWYWLDEKAVQANQTWRLKYNAISRRYNLSSGALGLPFASLDEVVSFLSKTRWRFADRSALVPGSTYQIEYRFRLDTSRLPAPYQANPLDTRDWTLNTGWKRFSYTVPEAAPAGGPSSVKDSGKVAEQPK